MGGIIIRAASRCGWQVLVLNPDLVLEKPMSLGIMLLKDPVHVHDFQATLLHLMGIDHEKLFFNSQGRRFRLTDVAGSLVKGILT
jgi:hypothetical protein